MVPTPARKERRHSAFSRRVADFFGTRCQVARLVTDAPEGNRGGRRCALLWQWHLADAGVPFQASGDYGDTAIPPRPWASVMVAVFVVDSGRCRFLNAVAEVLTGFSLSQARGNSLEHLVWRGNSAAFADSALGRTMGSSEGGEGEETILCADGKTRRFGYRVVPLDQGAAAVSVVIELIDLSGETGTARALRESEQRLRLAVEATGIGIWDVDAVTGKRQWSPEFFQDPRPSGGHRGGRTSLFRAHPSR